MRVAQVGPEVAAAAAVEEEEVVAAAGFPDLPLRFLLRLH